MSGKKMGLGRGLNTLIPKAPIVDEEDVEQVKKKVSRSSKSKKKAEPEKELTLPIDKIEPNPDQPRNQFDEDTLQELSDSIKQYGMLQPILVTPKDDFYEIIAGERRWRAAKYIGIKEIPAVIMDLTEKQILEISLIENIQREDLNSIEEAIAYKKLITDFDLTQEQLSKRIGKSRVAITNTMRLLNLSEDVQQYIIEGVISDSKLQCELAQNVIDDKLSVRELEFLIRKLKTKSEPSKSKAKKETNPYYKEVIEKLENYFGTKVNVTNRNN